MAGKKHYSLRESRGMAVEMRAITLRRFDDMHCHMRLEPMLSAVLPYTARYCGRALLMPNTRPRAIRTAADIAWYRDTVERGLEGLEDQPLFTPLFTVEVRDDTTSEIIVAADRAGAVAGKVYPRGVTTNADDGIHDFFSHGISETFHAMQEIGMPLLIHGELDRERTLVTDREAAFLPVLERLAGLFPRLKIVLEHVSSREGIRAVESFGENVAATITAHHLVLTLNDVIGDGVRPHHACMPMPKSFDDRDALIQAATSGNRKFFLGSDSAPHARAKKECAKGACGVFSAPVLPSVLAGIFEAAGSLDRLEDFTSRFGAEFYGLGLNDGQVTLVKDSWRVPDEIAGIVPFRAGEMLSWKLVS